MRVFVTGATGFVGSAVTAELIGAGHQVLGVSRSDEGAQALERAGAEVRRGDLADPAGLAEGARACDAIVHCAFNHDFSRYMENIETERGVVRTLIGALEGSDKPLVATFGVISLVAGRAATEEDEAPTGHPILARAEIEHQLTEAAGKGVRAIIMRLPPSVHGRGDKGFVPALVQIARQKGYAAYVGDGENRWPATHRLDVARLYRLGLEKAAPGARLHAMAEEGVRFRDIAETIGEGLGVPVRSFAPEEAGDYFGFLGMFAGGDASASSAITRETLGWAPREPDLLQDMKDSYFG